MHPFHVLVIQVFRQIKELKNKTKQNTCSNKSIFPRPKEVVLSFLSYCMAIGWDGRVNTQHVSNVLLALPPNQANLSLPACSYSTFARSLYLRFKKKIRSY